MNLLEISLEKEAVHVNYTRFFTSATVDALTNDPPGQWIPRTPKTCIRLQAGYPSPSLVPSKEIGQAALQVLEEERDKPLQYLGSAHAKALRDWIEHRLVDRNIPVKEDEFLITAGSAQAIDLAARVFLDEKAAVIVEAPTYMESLETFRNFTKDIVTAPVDELGLQPTVLESVLSDRQRRAEKSVKFLYTIPTNQNPTGVTMPYERRLQLLQLAENYDFLILEDDAYGELSFRESPPTLKSMDHTGRVIHLGSLSKIIAPGLRIGWAVGDERIISAMATMKKDLTHPFGEATVAKYLASVDWSSHVDFRLTQYRTRCQLMLDSLTRHMPPKVTWYVPTGGYFIWVHVPGAETNVLLQRALQEGVSFIAGKHFYANPADGDSFLRLSFSYADIEDIDEGIKRLADVINQNQFD